MGRPYRKPLRSVLQLGAMLAVAFTTRASFADHYRVPSGSMEPTVRVGDHILVNKAAYGVRVPLTEDWLVEFRPPARGDVVIVDATSRAVADEDTSHPVLVKRVVAVAGDTVEVRDGHVLIDGRARDEATASFDSGGGPDFGPVRVPNGKVLVLGDNRGNSRDGRTFGWVDRRSILGRAFLAIGNDVRGL